MRRTLSATVVAGLMVPQFSSAQQAWVPVWADEFSGTALNTADWQYQTGNGAEYGLPGWGNNELQYYTSRSQNIGVANGLLTITARRESYSGFNFTSARIRTLNRRDYTYGRFETRMRVPAGQGLWPAVWMLPSTSEYGGWASSGEIDILETVNAATAAHGTLHYGGPWPRNVSAGHSTTGAWSADFHTYAVEWEPDEIRWYVDGVLFHQVSSSVWFSETAPQNPRAPFDRSFHFLINLAVGGNWPGAPDGTTPFPSALQVDYLRVRQRPPKGPYSGTPPIPPARIEAEHYDLGGGSIAYVDTDAANLGGQLRTQEAVDIQSCSEGGFNLGWFRPGEWIDYTIQVPETRQYELRLRVATPNSGSQLRVDFAGIDRTGAITIPATAAWQTFRTVRAFVNLDSGLQSMRITNMGPSGRDINVNWVEMLVPGDADGNGRTQIDDLYAFDSGLGPYNDLDADGIPGTAFDRRILIGLLRTAEQAMLLQDRR